VAPAGRPIVYVAVGASDSVGIGASDPVTQAWPQVFYRTALPRAAVFFDLGIPGATVAEALGEEAPEALGLHPDLVTVLLSVNDMIHAVDVGTYRAELGQLLTELRARGRTEVLVANVAPLDHLPAYRRCAPYVPVGGGACDRTRYLPPDVLDQAVRVYNDAIAAEATGTGSILVDLYAAGMAARRDGTEASLISGDGFHPDAAGYRVIAQAFAKAYHAARS